MGKSICFNVAAALAVGVLGTLPALADPAVDFYSGRVISITVPTPAGAGFDLYGRALSAHMGRHIPGNPNMIVQYRPGAGGAAAAAWMYNIAPKDGSEIAIVLSPSVLVPVLRKAKFDATEFRWLGSITPRPSVVTVWHQSPATTLEGARQTELIMGATGTGSGTYLIPKLMNEVMGTRFKIVMGYPGAAAIDLAMEQGEVHGRFNYISGWRSVKADWIRDGKIVHIVQHGPRIPELADVPSLIDLAGTPLQREMVTFMSIPEDVGIGIYAPPLVPVERVAVLRRALEATTQDDAFVRELREKKLDLDPVSGTEIQQIVQKVKDITPPTLKRLRTILASTQ